jgi:hypothetical protein
VVSPKIKLLPQYNCNIVESGVKHHNHNPILRTITIRTIMNNYLTIFRSCVGKDVKSIAQTFQ